MRTLDLSRTSDGISDKLKRICGEAVERCYQCGKCTAGCPVAEDMDMPANQVIRLVQLGQGELALESEAIWLCLGCETCTARCPREVDLAGIMDALRELSMERNPAKAARKIRAFHQAFLDQIKLFGRVPEFALIGEYKLRSWAFFQDVLDAPTMAKKGKIKLMPQKVKGASEVRRIFKRCMEESARREK